MFHIQAGNTSTLGIFDGIIVWADYRSLSWLLQNDIFALEVLIKTQINVWEISRNYLIQK